MAISFPDVQSFVLYTIAVAIASGAFFGWLTTKIILVTVNVARRNTDSFQYLPDRQPYRSRETTYGNRN